MTKNLKIQEELKVLKALEEQDFNKDKLLFSADDFDFNDDDDNSYTIDTTTINLIPNQAPKQALIDFIKTAVYEEPYTIPYYGTYDTALKYIQRMRVELSRFRAQIIKLNKPLNHFYVLTLSIVIESKNKCIITLLKSKKRKKNKQYTALQDVFDYLIK